MRVFLFTSLFWILVGCGIPFSTKSPLDPLLFDAEEVARAERIAIFIPGALASINIFDDSADWEDAGYARAFYRFPGLDGLETDHQINPRVAADRIAAFANAYPDKDIALVGYSTGGPIALLAAPQITQDRRVRVAAMSTAVEHGGGLPTVGRGVVDIIRAMISTGSLERQVVWRRFWAGLLYGPDALDDPAFADRLERDIAAGDKIIVRLDPVIALSHTLGLPGFTLPDDLDLTGIPVGFFVGLNDRVFATSQTQRFARQIGGATIYGYREQGHLLFFTRPDVFADIRAFVEDRPLR